MKLGIGTYAYMWSIGFPGAMPVRPMSALHLLDKARELGVGVVQFGPNLPLNRLSREELDAVIGEARLRGMELEIATRGLETEVLRQQLDLARRASATLLRTVPELAGGRVPPLDEIGDCLRRIIPDLEQAGVRLALENGMIPSAPLARLLDSLATPWVGITLDTVNSLAIPEGTEQVARNSARHTMCLHAKDFAVQRVWHMMGFTVEGRAAGCGQLNIPWLLGVLRDAGVSPNAILELWPPQQETIEKTAVMEHVWAAQSIAYLRRYIPE